MKARTVTFKLQVPYTSNHAETAPAYASALASSIKTILETRLPIIADDRATDTGLIPVQVLIIVEPTPENSFDKRIYELLYLVAGCTVIGGFLWVVCGILTAFVGSFTPSVRFVHYSFE